MSTGILNNSGLPQPMLLDAIRFAETGHLSLDKARTAVSPKGAQGPYQFLQSNLHNMGYGMPQSITLADVQDPTKARQLAGQYVTGYSNHHNFTTTLDKLVAYNMGPKAAVEWKARGGRIEDLPGETQQYIQRAAKFLASAPTDEGNNTMAQKYRGLTQDQVARLAMADANMANQYEMPNNVAQLMIADANMAAQPQNRQAIQTASADDGYVTPTQMASADDGFIGPILSAINPIGSAQAATTTPVLTEAATETEQGKAVPQPILGTYKTATTGRRRDQSNMALPSTQIDTNEMLMRIGLAGVGASQQGGLAALQQMGQTYGSIMDANRANGLAAYQAMLENQGKEGNEASGNQMVYSQAALDSINTIENRVKTAASTWNPFDNVSGMIGNALSYIPGTPAHDVAMQIDTIEASIGFDRLQAMRDASPTGGALGQVSEKELALLKSSLGNLRQSQSREQFLRNLARVKQHYVGVINAFKNDGTLQGAREAGTSTGASSFEPPDDIKEIMKRNG